MVTTNQTAAFLLGVAIRKVFPEVDFCSTKASSQEFSCTFSYSETFSQDYFNLLEDALKKLSREEIKVMEMLASNAREFFLHHGQKQLAKNLEGIEGTVFVGQVEGFVDLCEKGLGECRYFSLLELTQEKRCVQITGIAFTTSQEQKSFLKKWRQYPKKNHAYLAKQLELYEEKDWHPKGVQFRHFLENLCQKKGREEGFEEIETLDPTAYFSKTGREKFILKNEFFDFSKNAIPSCLRLIQEWTAFFDLKYRWIFIHSHQKKANQLLKQGVKAANIAYSEEEGDVSQINLQIEDGLGRYCTGPFLQVGKQGMKFSLLPNSKRFIALLIERFEGVLPFWIAPEQVRIFPFADVEIAPVIEIFNRLGIRYLIDKRPCSLKEKMHRALHAKVPCVMVFGKQEEKSQQIKIRTLGSSLDETMTLKDMEQFLMGKNFEG